MTILPHETPSRDDIAAQFVHLTFVMVPGYLYIDILYPLYFLNPFLNNVDEKNFHNLSAIKYY